MINLTSRWSKSGLRGNPRVLLRGDRMAVGAWGRKFETTETTLSEDPEYNQKRKNQDRRSGRTGYITLVKLAERGELWPDFIDFVA
jgi:hypothetical protein